jgi:hypothetical protein
MVKDRSARSGWRSRRLDEHPGATIEEAALVASCLIALPGVGYREAEQTLRAMVERAASRRRTEGAANV